jgi:hypothetical protein
VAIAAALGTAAQAIAMAALGTAAAVAARAKARAMGRAAKAMATNRVVLAVLVLQSRGALGLLHTDAAVLFLPPFSGFPHHSGLPRNP